jgi:hypothetical protein
MSSPFQTANELAILFGARRLQWLSHPATSSGAPMFASDGVAIPTSAIRTMVVLDPGSGAASAEVWLYFEAIGKWCLVPGSATLFGALVADTPLAERISPAGAQRLYIRALTGSITAHVGCTILE